MGVSIWVSLRGNISTLFLTAVLTSFLSIPLLTAVSVHAIVPLKNYEQVKKTELFKWYIDGIGEGLSWANTYLEMMHRPKLFCQPENLSLYQENYLSILDKEIKAQEKTLKLDFPVEPLLLDGLIKNFPCR